MIERIDDRLTVYTAKRWFKTHPNRLSPSLVVVDKTGVGFSFHQASGAVIKYSRGNIELLERGEQCIERNLERFTNKLKHKQYEKQLLNPDIQAPTRYALGTIIQHTKHYLQGLALPQDEPSEKVVKTVNERIHLVDSLDLQKMAEVKRMVAQSIDEQAMSIEQFVREHQMT